MARTKLSAALAPEELRLIEKLERRGKLSPKFSKHKNRLKVFYSEQGNFTSAVVLLPQKSCEFIAVGVAKRNPTDGARLEIGRNLALSRALTQNPVAAYSESN